MQILAIIYLYTYKMKLELFIFFFSRSSTELDYLKAVYKDNYALFEQFIKDMVRTEIIS